MARVVLDSGGLIVLRETRQRRGSACAPSCGASARFGSWTCWRVGSTTRSCSLGGIAVGERSNFESSRDGIPASSPHSLHHQPNTPEAEAFIRDVAPDMMIARCKTLLHERIFTIPAKARS